jgi:mRNA interferase RelE/StbE
VVYRVELRPAALRDLKRLSREMQARIRPVLEQLAGDPRPPGVKKLAAQEDRYRIRVGDHRIVYEIQDEVLVIVVFRIAHRREVYR